MLISLRYLRVASLLIAVHGPAFSAPPTGNPSSSRAAVDSSGEPVWPDPQPLFDRLCTAQPKDEAAIVHAWAEQNKVQLEAFLSFQKEKAASHPAPVLPLVQEVEIPANASPELEDYLVLRAELYNSAIAADGPVLKAPSSQSTAAQQRWEKAHRPELQRQQQLAEKLAAQSETTAGMEIPDEPQIPPNASLALREFLTARHAMILERAVEAMKVEKMPLAKQAAARAMLMEEQGKRMQMLAAKLNRS